jgi:L-asparagine transporter-like permease
MKIDNITNWFLLITTVLVIGKAINLINISWYEAFIPLALLIVSFIVILIIAGFIYLKEQDGKK